MCVTNTNGKGPKLFKENKGSFIQAIQAYENKVLFPFIYFKVETFFKL